MKKNLQDNLYNKYPLLFAQKDLSIYESCMSQGICVGDGWYDIIDKLCFYIQHHVGYKRSNDFNRLKIYKELPFWKKLFVTNLKFVPLMKVEILQIKEKYGTLCFYVHGADNYIQGLIDLAESIARNTCEVCGCKGTSDVNLYKVRCFKHKHYKMTQSDTLVLHEKMGDISIDFDGVINSYTSGFVSIDEIPDPPVNNALNFIMSCVDVGFTVHIFSTRNRWDDGKRAIYKYLLKHGMSSNYIDKLNFPEHKPIAKVYIDDRAWEFNGTFPTLAELVNFKPWHGGKSSSQKD